MTDSLQLAYSEETVTFEEGSDYPQISGYGYKIPIKMYITNHDNPLNSMVIKIGDNLFLPSQIKNILDNHAAFLRATKAFYDVEGN